MRNPGKRLGVLGRDHIQRSLRRRVHQRHDARLDDAAGSVVTAREPRPLDTMTMRGFWDSSISGTIARVTRTGPSRLTPKQAMKSSGPVSSGVDRVPMMPALLMRTSNVPPVLRGDQVDRRRHGFVGCDVERDEAHVSSRFLKRGRRLFTPHGISGPEEDGPAEFAQSSGCFVAQALVGSGDQCRCHNPQVEGETAS